MFTVRLLVNPMSSPQRTGTSFFEIYPNPDPKDRLLSVLM